MLKDIPNSNSAFNLILWLLYKLFTRQFVKLFLLIKVICGEYYDVED